MYFTIGRQILPPVVMLGAPLAAASSLRVKLRVVGLPTSNLAPCIFGDVAPRWRTVAALHLGTAMLSRVFALITEEAGSRDTARSSRPVETRETATSNASQTTWLIQRHVVVHRGYQTEAWLRSGTPWAPPPELLLLYMSYTSAPEQLFTQCSQCFGQQDRIGLPDSELRVCHRLCCYFKLMRCGSTRPARRKPVPSRGCRRVLSLYRVTVLLVQPEVQYSTVQYRTPAARPASDECRVVHLVVHASQFL